MANLYLLDASVAIDAHQLYYPMDRVPQFWDWLLRHAREGRIKMPDEIHAEIAGNDEQLIDWMNANKNDLILTDQGYQGRVDEVVKLYAPDINDAELEQMGADPFLIAAALHLSAVVTTREVSKPKRQRGNRKIPDVCDSANVRWINDHQLIREPGLNFRIV